MNSNNKKKNFQCISVSIISMFFIGSLIGCGNSAFQFEKNLGLHSEDSENSSAEAPPSSPPQSYKPLLWDSAHPEGPSWTRFTLDLIGNDLDQDLLPGTDDVEDFCPGYFQLSQDQKIHFWGMLISSMTKFESGFKPTSRMQEPALGTDSITGQPVYSEGLLQLSYGDMKWAPFCKFDWNTDKDLSPTDPRKTILDPLRNLNCGIRIFARQVVKKNRIAAPAGSNYWSVLIPGGKYSKLSQIQELTSKSCKGQPLIAEGS